VHEQRRHPRVAINVPIVCELSNGTRLSATAADLSMGGLFVQAESAPAFGVELTIVGDFPGAPGLRLPSIVRWARPGGFGVQFGLLGVLDTRALTNLVHRRLASA
jgi:hypothetical protein